MHERGDHAPSHGRSLIRNFLWRLAALSAFAVPAGFVVADMTSRSLPGPPAPSQTAAILAARGNAADVATAKALALGALRSNPLDVAAVRTLATIAGLEGQPGRQAQLLGVAETLSRRDLNTQLLLIQDAAGQGRVGDALRHYDRVLTVSGSADAILIPRLVDALSDPAARDDVLALVRARRPWLQRLISAAAAPPADLLALGQAAGFDRHRQDDSKMLALLVGRMVDADAIHAARALAVVPAAADRLVQDGSFDAANETIVPFGWRFYNRGGWLSGPETTGIMSKLVLLARDATTDLVADQLIILPPGRYRLRFRGGGTAADPDAQSRVTVICGADPGRDLANVAIPVSSTSETVAAAFTVVDGCKRQRLRIVGGATSGMLTTAWITDIAITAIGT